MILSGAFLRSTSSGGGSNPYNQGSRTYTAGANQTILNTHIPAGVTSVRVTMIAGGGGAPGFGYGTQYGTPGSSGGNGGASSFSAAGVTVTCGGGLGSSSSTQYGGAGGTVSRVNGVVGLGTGGDPGMPNGYNVNYNGKSEVQGTISGAGIGSGGGGGSGVCYVNYCGTRYYSFPYSIPGIIFSSGLDLLTAYGPASSTQIVNRGYSAISDVRASYPSTALVSSSNYGQGATVYDGDLHLAHPLGSPGAGSIAIFIVPLQGATTYTNAITVGAGGTGGTGGTWVDNCGYSFNFPNGNNGFPGVCILEW